MSNNKNINSALRLERAVFDKIEFKRLGFKSDEEVELKIQSGIGKKQDEEIYRVSLTVTGNKPDEYVFEVTMSGYFVIESDENLTEHMKETLINKNSIAILMPYVRSEISLLTAQPEMDCVVMPVFNINKMFEE